MNARVVFLPAMMAALIIGSNAEATRYEVVPEDETIIVDDADAVLMQEYVKRARESMSNEKRRTAAVWLRRVAALANGAADTASGDARTALVAIAKEAQRLAYAAETRSDSAERRIGEFADRTENFTDGEWGLLEAKNCLARGDEKTAAVFLKLTGQQLARRAHRYGKDRGKPFEKATSEVESLLERLDLLEALEATQEVDDLIKIARELEPAAAKAKKAATTSSYRTPSYDYGAGTTYSYGSTEEAEDSSDDTYSGYDDTGEMGTGYKGSTYDSSGYGASDTSTTDTKKSSKDTSGMMP